MDGPKLLNYPIMFTKSLLLPPASLSTSEFYASVSKFAAINWNPPFGGPWPWHPMPTPKQYDLIDPSISQIVPFHGLYLQIMELGGYSENIPWEAVAADVQNWVDCQPKAELGLTEGFRLNANWIKRIYVRYLLGYEVYSRLVREALLKHQPIKGEDDKVARALAWHDFDSGDKSKLIVPKPGQLKPVENRGILSISRASMAVLPSGSTTSKFTLSQEKKRIAKHTKDYGRSDTAKFPLAPTVTRPITDGVATNGTSSSIEPELNRSMPCTPHLNDHSQRIIGNYVGFGSSGKTAIPNFGEWSEHVGWFGHEMAEWFGIRMKYEGGFWDYQVTEKYAVADRFDLPDVGSVSTITTPAHIESLRQSLLQLAPPRPPQVNLSASPTAALIRRSKGSPSLHEAIKSQALRNPAVEPKSEIYGEDPPRLFNRRGSLENKDTVIKPSRPPINPDSPSEEGFLYTLRQPRKIDPELLNPPPPRILQSPPRQKPTPIINEINIPYINSISASLESKDKVSAAPKNNGQLDNTMEQKRRSPNMDKLTNSVSNISITQSAEPQHIHPNQGAKRVGLVSETLPYLPGEALCTEECQNPCYIDHPYQEISLRTLDIIRETEVGIDASNMARIERGLPPRAEFYREQFFPKKEYRNEIRNAAERLTWTQGYTAGKHDAQAAEAEKGFRPKENWESQMLDMQQQSQGGGENNSSYQTDAHEKVADKPIVTSLNISQLQKQEMLKQQLNNQRMFENEVRQRQEGLSPSSKLKVAQKMYAELSLESAVGPYGEGPNQKHDLSTRAAEPQIPHEIKGKGKASQLYVNRPSITVSPPTPNKQNDNKSQQHQSRAPYDVMKTPTALTTEQIRKPKQETIAPEGYEFRSATTMPLPTFPTSGFDSARLMPPPPISANKMISEKKLNPEAKPFQYPKAATGTPKPPYLTTTHDNSFNPSSNTLKPNGVNLGLQSSAQEVPVNSAQRLANLPQPMDLGVCGLPIGYVKPGDCKIQPGKTSAGGMGRKLKNVEVLWSPATQNQRTLASQPGPSMNNSAPTVNDNAVERSLIPQPRLMNDSVSAGNGVQRSLNLQPTPMNGYSEARYGETPQQTAQMQNLGNPQYPQNPHLPQQIQQQVFKNVNWGNNQGYIQQMQQVQENVNWGNNQGYIQQMQQVQENLNVNDLAHQDTGYIAREDRIHLRNEMQRRDNNTTNFPGTPNPFNPLQPTYGGLPNGGLPNGSNHLHSINGQHLHSQQGSQQSSLLSSGQISPISIPLHYPGTAHPIYINIAELHLLLDFRARFEAAPPGTNIDPLVLGYSALQASVIACHLPHIVSTGFITAVSSLPPSVFELLRSPSRRPSAESAAILRLCALSSEIDDTNLNLAYIHSMYTTALRSLGVPTDLPTLLHPRAIHPQHLPLSELQMHLLLVQLNQIPGITLDPANDMFPPLSLSRWDWVVVKYRRALWLNGFRPMMGSPMPDPEGLKGVMWTKEELEWLKSSMGIASGVFGGAY